MVLSHLPFFDLSSLFVHYMTATFAPTKPSTVEWQVFGSMASRRPLCVTRVADLRWRCRSRVLATGN
eukprot:scaffold2989_cov184-Amphora_coffeaeformis.AAC.13